jgi:uncharacterized protein YkuJ
VYDGSGNLTEKRYFGKDGKPSLSKDGYARFQQTFDGHGNVTELVYFEVDGNNLALSKEGYARLSKWAA